MGGGDGECFMVGECLVTCEYDAVCDIGALSDDVDDVRGLVVGVMS